MATTSKGGTGKEKALICSFCGKSQDDVERMIIGPGVNICNECIELCYSLLGNDDDDKYQSEPAKARPRASQPPLRHEITVLTPQEIKSGLDQYVIDQDDAKMVLERALAAMPTRRARKEVLVRRGVLSQPYGRNLGPERLDEIDMAELERGMAAVAPYLTL